MKIQESADGTIRVVELDPTKWYWIIIDDDANVDARRIVRRDGLILVKRRGSTIEFVENADRIETT